MFCLLYKVQRDLLIHTPAHKVKTVQNTTFIWVYFLQLTHNILIMKTLSTCANQSKKLWLWTDTILPIICFIKYSCEGFGKIWTIKFIYVIFHIFYHILFYCISLIWQGNITRHCTTNMLCIDFRIYLKQKPTTPCWWSKIKNSWSTSARINSEPTTTDILQGAWIHRTKG